jgi:outer membrane scaffolding protein for murein synthesis (MipA/OmpV family)
MRVFPFFFLLWIGAAMAGEQSGYWELGAGVSYLQSPYYLGSDESKNYVLPFPHVLVRSEKLSIDRNNVRGHLISTECLKFDMSFSAAIKVDSEDSRLRQGMPDLDYILEAGPALKWLLKGEFNGPHRLTLDIPLRAAMVTDFDSAEAIGWRILPTLHWHHVLSGSGVWRIDNRLRLMYASRDFHDYLYSVDESYVTAERPYYRANEGFSGWQYRFTLRHRKGDRSMGFYLAYSNIADAVYSDSPLVAENDNFSGGVFVSWVLGRGHF